MFFAPETPSASLALVRPSLATLPRYRRALQAGWSPDNIGGRATAERQLAWIEEDAAAFVASLHDPEARGGDIVLPDGTTAKRLPGYALWIWDGDFCGSISLRWQPGTSALPDHVLGHVGYSVVSWKRGAGLATQALGLLLPRARAAGLSWVELTTTPENIPSQKVILLNGGRLIERFRKTAAYGGGEAVRFRIDLADCPMSSVAAKKPVRPG